MAVNGLRQGQIIWSDEFSASEDDKGVVTVLQSFHCYLSEFFKVAPKKGSPCTQPGWNALVLTNLAVENVKSGIAKVSCTYTFLNIENTFTFDGSQDTYESSVTTSEEPIASHKKYKDIPQSEMQVLQLAKSGSWVNIPGSYKFHPANIEEGVDDTELHDAMSFELWDLFYSKDVDAYLAIHQTFRETRYRRTLPTDLFKKVGRIDTPPSKAPALDADSNWLYSGATVTRQSSFYVITREWIASGPGGWVGELYA